VNGRISAIALGFALVVGLATEATLDGTDEERSEDRIGEEFEAAAASIIRIRTTARIVRETVDPLSGFMARFPYPLVIYGTGVIIDTTTVAGRREYVVLTNKHVVDPAMYFAAVRKLMEERHVDATVNMPVGAESYLVVSPDSMGDSGAIRLVEIAGDPASDIALLRTVNANSDLPVFAGEIGIDDEALARGDPVWTAGYPFGQGRISARGEITGTYDHDLGGRHRDFSVDLPLEPGQSGSPVFRVMANGSTEDPSLILVGLLHARESGTHLMVPFSLWRSALCGTSIGKRRSHACP